MKYVSYLIILVSLSIAVGFRAAELAPFVQKPDGHYSTGTIRAFCAAGVDYTDLLRDKTAAKRIGATCCGAWFLTAIRAIANNVVDKNKFVSGVGLWFWIWFAMTCIILRRYGPVMWLVLFAGITCSSLFMDEGYTWAAMPWDMPALFFASLAVTRKNPATLLGTLFLSVFFKETVICFSILFLFWPHTSWRLRLCWFGTAIVLFVLIRIWITWMLYNTMSPLPGYPENHVPMFATLLNNLGYFFKLHIAHPIFVGGGLIVAWLLAKPPIKYIAVFIAFACGIFFFANLPELRQWNEMLPMAIIGLFYGSKKNEALFPRIV
jgi:hypothetical protein